MAVDFGLWPRNEEITGFSEHFEAFDPQCTFITEGIPTVQDHITV